MKLSAVIKTWSRNILTWLITVGVAVVKNSMNSKEQGKIKNIRAL